MWRDPIVVLKESSLKSSDTLQAFIYPALFDSLADMEFIVDNKSLQGRLGKYHYSKQCNEKGDFEINGYYLNYSDSTLTEKHPFSCTYTVE